jgi:hypothetical protein
VTSTGVGGNCIYPCGAQFERFVSLLLMSAASFSSDDHQSLSKPRRSRFDMPPPSIDANASCTFNEAKIDELQPSIEANPDSIPNQAAGYSSRRSRFSVPTPNDSYERTVPLPSVSIQSFDHPSAAVPVASDHLFSMQSSLPSAPFVTATDQAFQQRLKKALAKNFAFIIKLVLFDRHRYPYPAI